MNENIDLTKILKDCPKGFKLYTPLIGEVVFEGIVYDIYPITVLYNDSEPLISFTKEGFYYYGKPDTECVLFPSKDQRDWSKFNAPWYKKEMDTNNMSNKDDERLRKTAIAFLKDFAEQGYENAVECIDWLEKQGEQASSQTNEELIREWTIQDAKNGDVLADEDNNIGIFQECEGMYWYSYTYLGCDGQLRGFSMGGCHEQTDTRPATKEQRDFLFRKIKEAGYKWNTETKTFEKLIKPKFDPKTLQPFDKVLVRDYENCKWKVDFYSYKEVCSGFPYICIGSIHKYCIPYNDDTKHLVGTCDEPPEFYRYWED